MTLAVGFLWFPTVWQSFFPSFDAMFTLFFIVFIIVAVFIVLSVIFGFFRSVKAGETVQNAVAEASASQVQEKEVIREIVKIRCPYCGSLYDETEDKCPNCGARR